MVRQPLCLYPVKALLIMELVKIKYVLYTEIPVNTVLLAY